MSQDFGIWVRSDGARMVAPIASRRRSRSLWRLAWGLVLLAVLLLGESCCADEDRWILTLHCDDGPYEVECYTQASCQTLADAVLGLGTACESGSIGVRRACQ